MAEMCLSFSNNVMVSETQEIADVGIWSNENNCSRNSASQAVSVIGVIPFPLTDAVWQSRKLIL